MIEHTLECALVVRRVDAQSNLANVLQRLGRLEEERVTGVRSRRDWTS